MTSMQSQLPIRQKLVDRVNRVRGKRQLLRTHSEAEIEEELAVYSSQPSKHTRHKSTSTSGKLAKLSATPYHFQPTASLSPASDRDRPLSPRASISSWRSGSSQSGVTNAALSHDLTSDSSPEVLLSFDFTRLDYELDRARELGAGLWSTVYLCRAREQEAQLDSNGVLTPPLSPRRHGFVSLESSAAVYAVKVPRRKDAIEVLDHEARVLTRLQYRLGSSQYVVTFFGQDPRNHVLVSEAVIGGSLEDLTSRLKHMTELARHQELVSIFPSIAIDLVSGLEFIHDTAGIVHADIKPQNILLDVSDHYSLPAPVIRARYIDFSAAYILDDDNQDVHAAGGGTWDFMPPEMMRSQREHNLPTFASDVWSLGITLLTMIILDSPYATAMNNNLFLLREAIKLGDPLGFARNEPTSKKRMDACQEYIDCCKLALQKDRDRRITASAWRSWIDVHF